MPDVCSKTTTNAELVSTEAKAGAWVLQPQSVTPSPHGAVPTEHTKGSTRHHEELHAPQRKSRHACGLGDHVFERYYSRLTCVALNCLYLATNKFLACCPAFLQRTQSVIGFDTTASV